MQDGKYYDSFGLNFIMHAKGKLISKVYAYFFVAFLERFGIIEKLIKYLIDLLDKRVAQA